MLALSVFLPEALPDERADWEQLRDAHLAEIRQAFRALRSHERVLLFCHDPTALPFLWQEEVVRERASQIRVTVVGHLHSRLILRLGRMLAGMPVIPFLGHSVRRLSAAIEAITCSCASMLASPALTAVATIPVPRGLVRMR